MGSLTPRQLKVVDFIRRFTAENGFAPTLGEIAKAFGVTKATAQEYVTSLEYRRVLTRDKYRHRSLALVEEELPAAVRTALPLVGRIAAGRPIEAIEDKEWIDLTQVLNPPDDRERYLLEVKGDSMKDDGILNGDYVIVERADSAPNGEVVVALLPDGSATLKRLYRERGRIRLQPANASMKPLFSKEVTIQGIVRGVLRPVRRVPPS